MGTVIGKPSLPTTPVIPETITSIEQVLKARLDTAKWAADVIKEVVRYLSDWQDQIAGREVPNPSFPGASGQELASRNAIYELSTQIKDKTEPIINKYLNAIDTIVQNNPPTLDISAIVDLVEQALTAELDENNPLSAYSMRAFVKSYVSTLLLDSTFDVLATDTTQITTTVDAYISRRQSEVDRQYAHTDRENWNQLASRGALDSEIVDTVQARNVNRKLRDYKEIDDAAEELRQRLLLDAFDRAFKRVDARLRGMTLLPLELPSGVYGMIADIVSRQYLDPNAFIGNLPNVIGFATEGYGTLINHLLQERTTRYEGANNELQAFGQYLDVITKGLSEIGLAVAKISTWEAVNNATI